MDSCSIMLQNPLLWTQNKGAVSRTQREKGMCGAHCLGPISMRKRGQVDGAKEEFQGCRLVISSSLLTENSLQDDRLVPK